MIEIKRLKFVFLFVMFLFFFVPYSCEQTAYKKASIEDCINITAYAIIAIESMYM